MENKKRAKKSPNRHIATINKDLYACVCADIASDDVIISKERIQHIKERHPRDIKLFENYAENILLDPDYIIESEEENTAVILKTIPPNNLKLVLKICTTKDKAFSSNWIVTFFRVKDKDFNKLLKNKKIIFEKNKKFS
jgi:hypothetical protein